MGATCLWLAGAAGALAQQVPRTGYVYPAGGRQGTTFQVVLGGQALDGVTNAYVSGAGVQAAVVDYVKPISAGQANILKERLQELVKKTPKDAETLKAIGEIRKKLATFVKKPANPAIVETVTVQMTIASNAPPGLRELRLGTAQGLCNPLRFCVGTWPEFTERAAKAVEPRKSARATFTPPTTATQPATGITLPTVVNGQIMPGEVARYQFRARKGQQLVAQVQARELVPYLPDAVPGWFQAVLALYDSRGREVAYADDFRFHPDPVLRFDIPLDGDYVIELRDALYRGREDFVYRLTIGEQPFITSIFPLGGPVGEVTSVTLRGWNLPTNQVAECPREAGVHPLSASQRMAGPVWFAADALPECREREPNHQMAAAQQVTLPLLINGRMDQPGDVDWYRFEGRAGETVVAEVMARRLDSPMDSVLKLTDAAGKQIAVNDDHEDKGAGLDTHHADSYLRVQLPATGTYYLQVSEAQRQGGPEYGYRLRLGAPQPDFALRVVPSSLNVRPGVCVPVTVFALRRDGFTNEISLALKGAPDGCSLSGASIPAGQDQVRITLTAPAAEDLGPVNLHMEGRAKVAGRELVRPGVPAEDMMQAFAYRHLVPAQELRLETVGTRRAAGKFSPRLLEFARLKIPEGGEVRVRLNLPEKALDRFRLELSDPPEGISLKRVEAGRFGAELIVAAERGKAKPGVAGNLIVNLHADKAVAAKAKTQANNRRPPVGVLPAIPFEIVSR